MKSIIKKNIIKISFAFVMILIIYTMIKTHINIKNIHEIIGEESELSALNTSLLSETISSSPSEETVEQFSSDGSLIAHVKNNNKGIQSNINNITGFDSKLNTNSSAIQSNTEYITGLNNKGYKVVSGNAHIFRHTNKSNKLIEYCLPKQNITDASFKDINENIIEIGGCCTTDIRNQTSFPCNRYIRGKSWSDNKSTCDNAGKAMCKYDCRGKGHQTDEHYEYTDVECTVTDENKLIPIESV